MRGDRHNKTCNPIFCILQAGDAASASTKSLDSRPGSKVFGKTQRSHTAQLNVYVRPPPTESNMLKTRQTGSHDNKRSRFAQPLLVIPRLKRRGCTVSTDPAIFVLYITSPALGPLPQPSYICTLSLGYSSMAKCFYSTPVRKDTSYTHGIALDHVHSGTATGQTPYCMQRYPTPTAAYHEHGPPSNMPHRFRRLLHVPVPR